jgi:Cu2+-exporting ATPase
VSAFSPHSGSCYHCGLPIPAGASFTKTLGDQECRFCCPACRVVAGMIHDSGMGKYYDYRTSPAPFPALEEGELPRALREELALYDDEREQSTFVTTHPDGSREALFSIEGITCAACSWLIDRQLSAVPGVVAAEVNLTTHRALVRWNPSGVALSKILQAIHRLGYRAYPYAPDREEQYRQQEERTLLRRLALAGIGMMQVMMVAVPLYTGLSGWIADDQKLLFRWAALLLTTPVVFYSSVPFFTAALRDLKTRYLTMDVSVSLAILGAYLASVWATFFDGREVYYDAVAMFAFFLLLGRYAEMKVRHRAGESGNRLLRLLPESAIRLLGSEQKVIARSQIEVGDTLLVKAGSTLPADGVVVEGNSGVDESALTGESHVVRKERGSKLLAGTINREAPITMAVTSTGNDTQISLVVRLLERARQEKPGIAHLADRVASHFVKVILLVTFAVYLYWHFTAPEEAFWIALSVLVVTCPCALALATPVALTAATASLGRAGILLARGHVLETLPRVTHVVFDKTGTLTTGEPVIDQIVPLNNFGEDECLAIAAALERYSEHPIAKAFATRCNGLPLPEVTDVTLVPGQGIAGTMGERTFRIGTPAYLEVTLAPPEASGQWVLLGEREQPLCWFRLSDRVREGAVASVRAVQARGVAVQILSGDPSSAAAELGRSLGVAEVFSGVSPEGKLAHIQRLQQQGAVVLMVGDGINDAPVLAAANLSIAMGCATDLARVHADLLLPRGNLDDMVHLLQKGVAVQRVIRQNLAWAVVYNLLALPLAAAGWVHPWMAAAGMSASSLLVVLNAFRLRGR